MLKDSLKAVSKEFDKDFKTQFHLNLFTKELVKLTVKAALNAPPPVPIGFAALHLP